MRYLIALFFVALIGNFSLQAQCSDCYSTPFLGVYSNGISKKKAKKLNFENIEGSYITAIIGNTAAEKGGLQPFDYIYGIDEYRTDYDRSLTSILKKYDIGDEVVVYYYRKGKKQQSRLKLGDRDDAEYDKKRKRADPFLGVQQKGSNWDDDFSGVKVDVVNNSSAEAMGLEDDDIITHINGFPILDWTDIGAAIDMTKVGNKMEVSYIRDGNSRKTQGTIMSSSETKYGSSYTYDTRDSKKRKIYHYDEDKHTHVHVDVNVNDSDHNHNHNQAGFISDSGSRNIDGMEVNLADLSTSQASDLNRTHGLDLATNNNLTINNLAIQANHNKGIFELNFDLPSRGNTIVDLYNKEGRNIYNYELANFSGNFEDTVDLAQNGTGTYYLQITQDGKNLVKEIKLTKE